MGRRKAVKLRDEDPDSLIGEGSGEGRANKAKEIAHDVSQADQCSS